MTIPDEASLRRLEKLSQLERAKSHLRMGGGAERIEKQHGAGKLTARERLDLLLDQDTFQESGLFVAHKSKFFGMEKQELPADGVVTGRGCVDGRMVHLASQDFTVAGGSAGEVHAGKIADTMKAALKTGSPFIFINDSGGARVQEGVGSLAGYARIFHQNVMLSGVVPQISLICGPCAGGAAYSPALTDFVIQTRDGLLFITGPAVIKQVTGEVVTAEDLGGARAQMNKSGVVHFVAENDVEAVAICRRLLSFLPSHNLEDPPRAEADDEGLYNPELNEIVPEDAKLGYDVRDVIARLLDRADFLEVHAEFARNVVVGFGRLRGRTVGVVANQPSVMAGVLDIDASDKAAALRPLLQRLQHSAGHAGRYPRVPARRGPGIRRHHPARRQAAVRLFGRHRSENHRDPAQGLWRRVHRHVRQGSGRGLHRGVALGRDCGHGSGSGSRNHFPPRIWRKAADREARRDELIRQYRETFYTPYVAAGHGLVDDIIEPAQTRGYIADALEALITKRDWRPQKKHGLTPL